MTGRRSSAPMSLLGDVLLEDAVVDGTHLVDDLRPLRLRRLAQIVRNGDLRPRGTQVGGVPHERAHREQIDDAREVGLRTDRQLQHEGRAAQPLADAVDAEEEVGAGAIELVDETDAGHAVAVRLAPHGLGLRLDACHTVEHRHGTVQHAQRALDLHGEVHVAGRIDDVDAAVTPGAMGRGRGDRDPALLLLSHPIHRGGPVVHLADLVVHAGVVQEALGRRGLARVDMGHDADVACSFEGLWRHDGALR